MSHLGRHRDFCYASVVAALPAEVHWLFWETEPAALDTEVNRRDILARVLERGRLEDVAWAMRCYGEAEILEFFRHGHPAISKKTARFWQLYLNAQDETWPHPARSRANNSAPWID